MINRHARILVVGLALAAAGCGRNNPVNMAPPSAPMGPPMGSQNNGGNGPQGQYSGQNQNQYADQNQGQNQYQNQAQSAYQWQDVPQGQNVPVTRAVFDQAGYQVFAASGETIVIPFANQNLYVMKFGRTNSQPYFVNEGDAPVLYLPPNFALENAAAQNARWYPIPQNYAYQQPMYVSLAPTWSDYTAMGWYPGMNYYGGMWGYSPHATFAWMPGFYVNIGGQRYSNYMNYRSYYMSNPGYTRTRVIYNNYSAPRSMSTGFGRVNRSTYTPSTRRTFAPANSPSSRPFGGRTSGGSFQSGTPRGFSSPTPRGGGSFGQGGGGGRSTPRGSFGSSPRRRQ